MPKMKTEDGVQFPSSAYAYVPDADSPSTWKLRLWETPQDKETARRVGMALAAIGPGFRGNRVDIPSSDMPGVKRKVLAAWRKTHPGSSENDVPSVLKTEGGTMTIEELQAKVADFEKQLNDAIKRADEEAKRANEAEKKLVVAQMSKEDRDIFDAFEDAKKAAYFEADADGRKAILDDARKEATEKRDAAVPEEVRKELDDLKKRLDESEAKARAAETTAKTEREARQRVELTKRATEEFANLQGTLEDKVEMLKAVEGLPDKERDAVLKQLKTVNDGISPLLKQIGSDVSTSDTPSHAWGKIEKASKELASSQNISFAKAQDQYLQTEQGQKDYAAYLKESKPV